MADKKREFHLFLLTDYEKEAEFLREKSQAGYQLENVSLFRIYTFVKSTPKDTVYQLDFRVPEKDPGEFAHYLQLYRDFGWEYVTSVNDFNYFRKPAADFAAADLEVFSDDQSKLAMLNRIIRRRLLPLLLLFFLCILPQLYFFSRVNQPSSVKITGLAVFSLFFLIYLGIFIHTFLRVRRLRKKYQS